MASSTELLTIFSNGFLIDKDKSRYIEGLLEILLHFKHFTNPSVLPW